MIFSTIAVLALLFAIMLSEYNAYFKTWAHDPNVPDAYAADYTALGELLNQMPRNVKKFVVVPDGGTLVTTPDGSQSIPMAAQTVMFITDTWTPNKQRVKNIFYITEEQYQKHQYPKDATILPLNP